MRAGVELLDIVDKLPGKLATLRTMVEVEGTGVRACVAESMVRHTP